MMFSLSASRLILPGDDDVVVSSSFLDRSLLSDLDGEKPKWTEDEMKLYMRGVEDNTTVVTISANVYYSLEVGERTGGKIADLVDAEIEGLNTRLEKNGVLARFQVHCLEEMTWWEEEFEEYEKYRSYIFSEYAEYGTYPSGHKHSADVSFYIGFIAAPGAWARGMGGDGLSASYSDFAADMVSWYALKGIGGGISQHELGHNLGMSHAEMKNPYWSRVWKELRFAAAAIGDESGTCRREAADWEFRSRCFKSFGNYTGDELDGEICTPAKDAKACQDHCAETEGCSFFQFREEAVSCGGHRAENCASCPQVVDLYPFCHFLSF